MQLLYSYDLYCLSLKKIVGIFLTLINSYRNDAEAYSEERKTKLLASVQCEHTDQGELSRV